MPHVLALDLGGTKLSCALFDADGVMHDHEEHALRGLDGDAVGRLIQDRVRHFIPSTPDAIAIAVPGLVRRETGRVWAPNIPGWDDHPLLERLRTVAGDVPLVIDDDRACAVMGECWKGKGAGMRDVIFMAVGTGIGAGILVNGQVLRGAHGTAGSMGWMTSEHGNLESLASGSGMASIVRRHAKDVLEGRQVFEAWKSGDAIATAVVDQAVRQWGHAIADLVSLFDPEAIFLGGGIFGPASELIQRIHEEASKHAQPLSFPRVRLEASALGHLAVLHGAARAAFDQINPL